MSLKIDNITLKIYKIVVSTFFLLNKDDKLKFLKNNFLLVKVCLCRYNILRMWWKYDGDVITSVVEHICVNHLIYIYK